jgi:hypothetical protein
MHTQADDLLKIAQGTKPATKPAPKKPITQPPGKPKAPTARPVLMMTPAEQNNRVTWYKKEFNDKITTLDKAKSFATALEGQYKNNYLDYSAYKTLIDELNKSTLNKGLGSLNAQPIAPMNPTAFSANVNEKPMMGQTDPVTGKVNSIQLATPLEGLTAAGEKALPNREDRNLPGLVNEWNEYLKTDSFKTSIEERIKELKRLGQDTTQLQQLLDKANKKDGLQVGDFGNDGKASEVYGVEAKPLTSITGTPTTPAAGTATTATTATPVAPVAPNSAAKNPGSR